MASCDYLRIKKSCPFVESTTGERFRIFMLNFGSGSIARQGLHLRIKGQSEVIRQIMTDLVLTNPWKDQKMSIRDDDLQKDTLTAEEILAEKLKIAKVEIGEDDKTKEQCLTQLREWISQNWDIQNCLTDDNFLLRFLRTKKYSLFMAQQMILKYLNLRKRFSYMMDMMDFEETKVNELISSGYIFASPIRDSYGRRVVIYNIEKLDVQRYTNVDMGRAHTITYEAVLEDEETQIFGVNHVANMKGASGALTSLFSISEFARIILWGEQSFPMRHKEMNFLHFPAAVRFIYEFAVSKMTKKHSQRFELHDSQEGLHNKVDRNCLPLELGGVMPMAEMIQLWKKELTQKRSRLLTINDMKLLNDRGIIKSKNVGEHIPSSNMEGLTGSFRKLEVD